MIHPSAHVHPTAEVADDVEIGPFCLVEAHARVGAGSRLMSHATVGEHTRIGERNVLHPGTVIGGPPQDKTYRGEPTRLVVGDDNVFRECVTINRGTVKGGGLTTVGDRNLFMACVHAGHDCAIGNDIVFSNNVLLAGHATIGDRVVLGGAVALHHFVRVGRMAYMGGMTRCVFDAPPFCKVSGDPGRVRHLNLIGLQRAGLSEATIEELQTVYATLFRTRQPLSVALGEVQVTPGSPGEELVLWLREWVQSPKGRFNEMFRTDARPAGDSKGASS